MQRNASAEWKGTLKEGKGTISSDSGVLHDTQYSFSTRFENGIGTNPEELIAAAHAGCFAMAFSAELGKAGASAKNLSADLERQNLALEKANVAAKSAGVNHVLVFPCCAA